MHSPIFPAARGGLAVLLLACLILAACTDPITVGSDLLDEDRTDVGVTTDIPFTTRVVRDDSLFTFSGSTFSLPAPFTFGQISDEVFGTTTHGVYLAPRLPRIQTATGSSIVVPPFAERITSSIDSIVVLIPLDTAKMFYGPGRSFPFRASVISAPVPFEGTDFYSTVILPTEGGDVSETGSFVASGAARPVGDTAIAGPDIARPHVRLRMGGALLERFNRLRPNDFTADSIFRQAFAGLYLEPTGESDALLGLAVQEDSRRDTLFNGFNVYYQDSTGRPAVYRIGFLQALPTYTHDYTNSLVGELLQGQRQGEVAAVVGQGGVLTEIEFTDLAALQGRVVNQAVLDIPLLTIEGYDYSRYPPPGRIEVLYRPTPDSDLRFIEEAATLRRAGARGAAFDLFLGGKLVEIDGQRRYRPNFSIHLQRILDERVPPRIYLRLTPQPGNTSDFRVARALLTGPDATSELKATVSVTFTDLE